MLISVQDSKDNVAKDLYFIKAFYLKLSVFFKFTLKLIFDMF